MGLKKQISLFLIITFVLVAISSSVSAVAPRKIVFLSTKSDLMGCYFKQGEEAKVKHRFKDAFPYGTEVCMRAYTHGKIGEQINVQDWVNGKFYKGYIAPFKWSDGNTVFRVVRKSIMAVNHLPRGRHCISLYVTGPGPEKRTHGGKRRLAAKGCFSIY